MGHAVVPQIKGGGSALGGLPFSNPACADLYDPARWNADAGAKLASVVQPIWEPAMDPINIALALIVIALVAILPCGIIMTRRSPGKPGGSSTH